LIFSIWAASNFTKSKEETKYYQIVDMVINNEISEYQLNLYNGELIYKKRDDAKKTYRYKVAEPNIFYNDVNEAVMEINKAMKRI
jgi:hypothetical protein